MYIIHEENGSNVITAVSKSVDVNDVIESIVSDKNKCFVIENKPNHSIDCYFADYENGKLVFKETMRRQVLLNKIRKQRNEMLKATDWAVLPDSPHKDNQDVISYRKALREFPSVVDFKDVKFPEKPDVLK